MCIFVVGVLDAILYGLSFPIFSVQLEQDGLSSSLIGLSTTFGALGALIAGVQFPRLIRRLGYRAFTATAFAIALLAVVGLPLSDRAQLWFALRLVLCVALAAMWVSTDAWLSDIVPERHRGRLTGGFQALYCFGFFIGPSLTYFTGFTGYRPVLAMAVLCITALITLCFAANPQGSDHLPDEPAGWRNFHRLTGTVTVLVLAGLVGVCETAVYTLLPIYGIHRGLSTESAVGTLVAYTLGEAVIALPVGWLADRFNRERILVASAIISSICFVLLAATVQPQLYAKGAAFAAGGFVASLYNTSIVLIGARFDRVVLPTVITAFTMSYSLGSVVGSAMGGAAMDVFGPSGLPIFLSAALGLTGLALLARTIVDGRPAAQKRPVYPHDRDEALQTGDDR